MALLVGAIIDKSLPRNRNERKIVNMYLKFFGRWQAFDMANISFNFLRVVVGKDFEGYSRSHRKGRKREVR